MTTSYALFGDGLLPPSSSLEQNSKSSGLVWGIDLSQSTSKHLGKEKLHESEAKLRRQLDRSPAVKKVIVAFQLPRTTNFFSKVTVPERLATRLHSDLERDRARDVQFLFLDVTHCQDLDLLRHRIDEVMQLPASTWSTISLDWREVQLRPIKDVIAEQVL